MSATVAEGFFFCLVGLFVCFRFFKCQKEFWRVSKVQMRNTVILVCFFFNIMWKNATLCHSRAFCGLMCTSCGERPESNTAPEVREDAHSTSAKLHV